MARPSLDHILEALADPTRRRVVDLLRKAPRRASELAEALDTTRPAMSRHLRVLRRAGVVGEDGVDDDARVRMYHLQHAPFRSLRAWVEDVEALWDEQLVAFKTFAESRRK
jgi:DNA-binding transcriptional ArsR family regulator